MKKAKEEQLKNIDEKFKENLEGNAENPTVKSNNNNNNNQNPLDKNAADMIEKPKPRKKTLQSKLYIILPKFLKIFHL